MNPFNNIPSSSNTLNNTPSSNNTDPVPNHDQMNTESDTQTESETEQLMVEGEVEYNSDDYDMEIQ